MSVTLYGLMTAGAMYDILFGRDVSFIKSLIITIVMVLFLIAIRGGFLVYTESSSIMLYESMKDVRDFSDLGEWDRALSSCDDFINEWNKCSGIYTLYMDGVCVHDIELSAKRCRSYVEAQNRGLAAGEAASILSHIELMKENDRLISGNIF